MIPKHAVVWIDEEEARIFGADEEILIETTIIAPLENAHRERRRGVEGFFHEVARALAGIEEVLIVGPSTAKLELLRFVEKNNPVLESHVVGIETVEHPTDGELVVYARRYFDLTDRVVMSGCYAV